MRRTLLIPSLALALMLALAACGLFPVIGGPQVTGNLKDAGSWPRDTRIALVGYGSGGALSYDNQRQVVDEDVFDGYLLELPNGAAQGSYQLVGYVDANGDNKLDAGEARGDSGNVYFIYADKAGTLDTFAGSVAVEQGWNELVAGKAQSADNPFQADTYTGVDLTLK